MHLHRVERLDHKIVGAKVEALDALAALIGTRKYDNGYLRIQVTGFRYFQKLFAAQVGHVKVGNDQISLVTFFKPQHPFRAVAFDYDIEVLLKKMFQYLGNAGFVVYNQQISSIVHRLGK